MANLLISSNYDSNKDYLMAADRNKKRNNAGARAAPYAQTGQTRGHGINNAGTGPSSSQRQDIYEDNHDEEQRTYQMEGSPQVL